MEQARQQALEMKDELVLGFQEIRDNFPDDFGGKKLDQKNVKRSHQRVRSSFKTPSWVFEQQGKEWLQQVDVLLNHLVNNLEDTDVPFEDIVDEMYIILKTVDRDGKASTIDIALCPKETFIFHIIRECLYYKKLQITFSDTWKEFAKKYSRYIMSI